MHDTVLVVPCFNEAHRLPLATFEAFLRHHPDAGLLMVNDGSTDDTQARLEQLRRGSPEQVQVLNLVSNVGKAEAVRRGLQAAIRSGPRYVGFWDADLATPLEAYRQFRDILSARCATVMVLGSRIPLLGRRIQRRPLRYLMGRGFARVASWMLGLKVFDTQCGAKLLRVTCSTEAALEQPFLSRWIFDVELLARLMTAETPGAARGGEAFYELPLEVWRDVKGSKVRFRDVLRAGFELAAIYRKYRRALRVAWRAARPYDEDATGGFPDGVAPRRPASRWTTRDAA